MDCKNFLDKMSLYIDDEMTEIEKKEFELHILECQNCRKEYENMLSILNFVRNQAQEELPDNYRSELRLKLKEYADEKKKLNWRVISSVAAGFIILFLSISMFSDNLFFIKSENQEGVRDLASTELGSTEADKVEGIAALKDDVIEEIEENDNNTMFTEANIAQSDYKTNDSPEGIIDSIESLDDSSQEIASCDYSNDYGIMSYRSNLGNGRKSIMRAYITIDINNLDDIAKKIGDFVEENSGYLEKENIEIVSSDTEHKENMYLLKLRIPVKTFEKTLEFLKTLGEFSKEEIIKDDITERYREIQVELRVLYDQESLLMNILPKIEYENDKILINDELEKIRENINTVKNHLEEIDNSLSYSIIDIKLNEVDTDNN